MQFEPLRFEHNVLCVQLYNKPSVVRGGRIFDKGRKRVKKPEEVPLNRPVTVSCHKARNIFDKQFFTEQTPRNGEPAPLKRYEDGVVVDTGYAVAQSGFSYCLTK